MKPFYLILFASIIAIQAYSQNAVISGRVIEQSTKNPIPFANVILLADKSDKVLTGIITEDDGRFVLKGLNEGNYTINISFIGYETKTIPVLVGKLNETFDLGKIELQTSSENIDEVIVSAKREIVSS